MNSFSKHPARTWKTIQDEFTTLSSSRLEQKDYIYSKLIDEVASKIHFDDFNNKPLSGKYLLGFYSQRHEFIKKRKK